MTTGPKMLVIDGDNAVHRFIHVSSSSERPMAPAAERFGSYLGRLLRTHRPTHAIVVFDPLDGQRGECWRTKIWPGYKEGRGGNEYDGVLSDAYDQCAYWGVSATRTSDEADDVVASYVHAAVTLLMDVVVVSTDKDFLQLVRSGTPSVTQLDQVRKKTWTPAEVERKFNVTPAQFPDFLALVGDKIDNIPGVRGIGARGAVKILAKHGSLESALRQPDEGRGPLRKAQQSQDAVLKFLRIVTLRTDVPLPVPLSETSYYGRDRTRPSQADLFESLPPTGDAHVQDSLS